MRGPGANVKSLPCGTKTNWGLRNGTLTLQTGSTAKKQAEAAAGKWAVARVQVLSLTVQKDQDIMEM